jgi:tRNA (guanine37-N1)-methyltransferase
MRVDTLSVFPQLFSPYIETSMMGIAQQKGLLSSYSHDLRDWTHDHHRTTDDEPYGGGQGQLMKCEPVFEALDTLQGETGQATTIFLTPCGEPFSQAIATELAVLPQLIFVCGRYEGFDQRVYTRADRCLSLGDYVLTGGELAALVVIDAVVRLLPGVLGDEGSAVEDSFCEGLLEFPQYTRPAVIRDLEVPPVLLSGDHARIASWRRCEAIRNTALLRPDLLSAADLTEEERVFAQDVQAQAHK